VSASQVADVLRQVRVAMTTEKDLQAGIGEALTQAGIQHRREVTVTGGVIDFTVGRIGIEVKVKGSVSSVARQLQRYAHAPELDELVVATTRPGLADLPASLGGKAVTVVVMRGAAW
jgi:hypothetical protein